MTEQESLIRVENLTAGYGDIAIIKDINFEVQAGEVFIILGGSGCGKSTLLKICAGVLNFDSGEVLIDDHSIISDYISARLDLGYLPEMPYMYERLTGREFLLYISSLRNLDDAEMVRQLYRFPLDIHRQRLYHQRCCTNRRTGEGGEDLYLEYNGGKNKKSLFPHCPR